MVRSRTLPTLEAEVMLHCKGYEILFQITRSCRSSLQRQQGENSCQQEVRKDKRKHKLFLYWWNREEIIQRARRLRRMDESEQGEQAATDQPQGRATRPPVDQIHKKAGPDHRRDDEAVAQHHD